MTAEYIDLFTSMNAELIKEQTMTERFINNNPTAVRYRN
jgi:hypothetical protein